MITLYTWTTPNGRKPAILLEELGLPYKLEVVNLGKNEQFAPAFLRVSPNNKIPAITDDEVLSDGKPLAVFESAAILTYLAEKSGRFLPKSGPDRYKTLEWLTWQVAGHGPMLGQLAYFAVRAPEKNPAAIDRFKTEGERLLGVMDRRLQETPYLAGGDYSIADIATYPWTIVVKETLKDVLGDSFMSKTALRRWLDLVGDRPAVQRGMNIPKI